MLRFGCQPDKHGLKLMSAIPTATISGLAVVARPKQPPLSTGTVSSSKALTIGSWPPVFTSKPLRFASDSVQEGILYRAFIRPVRRS